MNQRRYPNRPEPWLTTVIEDKDGEKHVTILSSLHVTKSFTMPHSYGMSFTDWQIMLDSDYLRCVAPFR